MRTDKDIAQEREPHTFGESVNWLRLWDRLQNSDAERPNGFLRDYGVLFGSSSHPNRKSLDCLLDHQCLVLCGEPGMGKSRILEQHRKAILETAGGPEHVFWRSFHRDLLGATDLLYQLKGSDQQRLWLNGKALTIVIDGIDEGLVDEPNLLGAIIEYFTEKPLARLRLIITCRDLEWSRSNGDELLRLWESNTKKDVYLLQQLRWSDAHQAARHWGASEPSADRFMKAIDDRGVEAFACRPITLRMLFREFELKGKLPQSRVVLFQRACMRLCQEDDDRLRRLRRKQPQFSCEILYSTASRIAARMLVGRRSGISLQPIESRNSKELGSEDVTDPTGQTDHNAVSAALETALFADGGKRRRVFSHQTYGEFLAAEHLARFSLPQLTSVLCAEHSGKRHVIPQLGELAAWVALLHKDFLDWLIGNEPEVLLRNDASTLSSDKKKKLVQCLLRRMADETTFDDRGLDRYYESLKHVSLAENIRPYITNKKANRVVRRTAIDFASFCNIYDVFDDCLRVALDPKDDYQLRHQAMDVVVRDIPDTRLAEIEPLAVGKLGPDPDDELRACALKALVPKQWKVSETISILRDAKKETGPLFYLSDDLSKLIDLEDLPKLFEELEKHRQVFSGYVNPIRPIAQAAVILGINHLEVPRIAVALMRFIKAKLKTHELIGVICDENGDNYFKNAKEQRRAFIKFLFSNGGIELDQCRSIRFTSVFPVEMSDCGWALAQFREAEATQREFWADFVSSFWPGVAFDTEWRDEYLDAISRDPQLSTKFKWPICTVLGSEQEKYEREINERNKNIKRNTREKHVSAKQLFAEAFKQAAKDAKQWPTLAWAIQRETDEKELFAITNDPTKRQLWKEASAETLQQILEIARRFLLENSFSAKNGQYIPNYRMPAFWAIWLLRRDIEDDCNLSDAVKSKWLAVIIEHSDANGEEAQQMMCLGKKLDTSRCKNFLQQEIEEALEKNPYLVSALTKFELAWDNSLSSVLFHKIGEKNIVGKHLSDALWHLARHDTALLKDWLSHRILDLQDNESASPLAAAAIACFPEDFWSVVWPQLLKNDELARKTVTHLIYGHCYRQINVMANWTEVQFGDFYLRLEQIMPSANDPGYVDGEVTEIHNLRDFRRYLRGALEARGTDEAAQQFLRLANTFPEQRIWLRWSARDAFATMLRNHWQGVAPDVLQALEAKNEARWVTNNDDLQELVLESLQRFQLKLPSVVYRLWNQGRSKLSPKDEKILSREIREWLESDLGPKNGIVAGCEVQPSIFHAYDILVSAQPKSDQPSPSFFAVLEVKRHYHDKVDTSLENQLVQKYLIEDQRSHGIYIVGWYNSLAWNKTSKLKVKTIAAADKKLAQLARESQSKHPELTIATLCIDCTYPQTPRKKNRKAYERSHKAVRKRVKKRRRR